MGYTLYRKDRSNQAYGVVRIAVRSELVSSACPDLDTDCELLWVQIDLTGAKSLHIGAFYRPPDSDVTTLENLNQSLQRLNHRTNGNIWLGGDFNAPHINWPLLEVTPLAGTKRQIYQRLNDISLHHNIEQIIDKPTNNTLDLFLNNNKSALQNFETLPPIGKADHDIVYIEINARPNRQNTPQRNIFIFRKANWDGIKSKLATLLNCMHSTTEQPSINTQWTVLKTTLLKAMQEFITQKQIKHKHCLPWVTQRIRKLIRVKYKLHSKLKHNPRTDTKDKYKQARLTLQKETRKSYWAFLENTIDYTSEPNKQDRHTKQKRFWSFIKSTGKDSSGISPLRHQGIVHSDATSKADILAEHFSAIYTHEQPGPLPNKGPSSYSSMPDINISATGIQHILSNLKPHKAAGPDTIPPTVLKELSHQSSPILEIIFNKSLQTGQVPND